MAQAAIEHQECAMCLYPLFQQPVCFLVEGGRRVCRHPYHKGCVDLPVSVFQGGERRCPICRKGFSEVLDLPNPESDPRGFFSAIDCDRSGCLSREEVMDGLKACLDLDWRTIDRSIDALWSTWDSDSSDSISFDEMTRPHSGLLAFVKRNYPGSPQDRLREPPDIRQRPREWFSFWDENANGSLSKSEIIRALVKTFRTDNVHTITECVEAVFPLFDPDGSGEVDVNEFTMRDGLCDTIIASVASLISTNR